MSTIKISFPKGMIIYITPSGQHRVIKIDNKEIVKKYFSKIDGC